VEAVLFSRFAARPRRIQAKYPILGVRQFWEQEVEMQHWPAERAKYLEMRPLPRENKSLFWLAGTTARSL